MTVLGLLFNWTLHSRDSRLQIMKTSVLVPTIIGLGLAFGGPVLIASADEKTASVAASLTPQLLGQLALVGLCAGVLAVLLCWEQQPLSSVGLYALRWHSLGWGVALACFFIFVFSPAAFWLLPRFGFAGFEVGLAKLAPLPVWYLVLAVVIGGTVEEILYRGYAVERLAVLTGSYWVAGLTSVLAFGLAHVPMWGWEPSLTTCVSGGMLTLFYVWTRDLTANILAHLITDFVGIVLPPLLAMAQ
jgi:CAAX protease family protein